MQRSSYSPSERVSKRKGTPYLFPSFLFPNFRITQVIPDRFTVDCWTPVWFTPAPEGKANVGGGVLSPTLESKRATERTTVSGIAERFASLMDEIVVNMVSRFTHWYILIVREECGPKFSYPLAAFTLMRVGRLPSLQLLPALLALATLTVTAAESPFDSDSRKLISDGQPVIDNTLLLPLNGQLTRDRINGLLVPPKLWPRQQESICVANYTACVGTGFCCPDGSVCCPDEFSHPSANAFVEGEGMRRMTRMTPLLDVSPF